MIQSVDGSKPEVATSVPSAIAAIRGEMDERNDEVGRRDGWDIAFRVSTDVAPDECQVFTDQVPLSELVVVLSGERRRSTTRTYLGLVRHSRSRPYTTLSVNGLRLPIEGSNPSSTP